VFQTAASKVAGKFPLYMRRQGLALGSHHVSEFRVVPLNDLVKKRPYRMMALVWRAVAFILLYFLAAGLNRLLIILMSDEHQGLGKRDRAQIQLKKYRVLDF
jgi:hypothetical protein